jgi:CheY-like chemotaxis protein/Tfp pilus assembly protein PilZ
MADTKLGHDDSAVLLLIREDRSSTVIERELREHGVGVETVPGAAFRERIETATPRAIVLATDLEHATSLCLLVRGNPALSAVPVLWCVDALDDLIFEEAFTVGADDVLLVTNTNGLSRRLSALPPGLSSRKTLSRGTALVADAGQQRRIVPARLLRNFGFDVEFAVDARDLADRARADRVAVVIADVDLEEGRVLAELDAVRSEGNRVPWILRTPPKKLRAASDATRDVEGAWVSDAFAPPDNVLYAVNEALRGPFTENRASPRLLFGTTVAFRVAGRDTDEWGYVYNVSEGGLFIRTMAALRPGDDAWLELKPPRTDRRVRLEAAVVWKRPYDPATQAVVPPGFGVRITGGSETDLERYRRGYRALAADLAGIRFSTPPKRG